LLKIINYYTPILTFETVYTVQHNTSYVGYKSVHLDRIPIKGLRERLGLDDIIHLGIQLFFDCGKQAHQTKNSGIVSAG